MSNSARVFIVLLVSSGLLALVRPTPQAEGRVLPQGVLSPDSGMSQQVLREVSQLRGLRVLGSVKVAVRSRGEIEQSLVRDMDEKTPAGEWQAESKALKLLGLIPRDFKLRDFLIRLLTEQIAGYYRPETKTLVLADWLDPEAQHTVMVHELMHALQDQHFDLGRFEDPPPGQSDRDLAVQALIEGEATAVMLNYMLKPLQLDMTRLPHPLSRLFEKMGEPVSARDRLLHTAPLVLRETLMFPYTYGLGFVQVLLSQASWSRVSEAYKNPPESSEQILHPDRFLHRDAPTEVHLARLEPILGEQWKRRLIDVNGEFGAFLILAQYIDRETARRAAEGWDGDQLALYEDTRQGTLLLVYLSTWDSADEAREFVTAYVQRVERRYSRVKEIPTGAAPARAWKTPNGFVSLDIRGGDVLMIETAGQFSWSTLQRVARTLWKGQRRCAEGASGPALGTVAMRSE